MSLIDEALKRARMEAAQRAAEKEGLPYPTIPRHLGPRRRRRGWLAPAALFLAVLGGVAVGVLLTRRGEAPARQLAAAGPSGAPATKPETSQPAAPEAIRPESPPAVAAPLAGEPAPVSPAAGPVTVPSSPPSAAAPVDAETIRPTEAPGDPAARPTGSAAPEAGDTKAASRPSRRPPGTELPSPAAAASRPAATPVRPPEPPTAARPEAAAEPPTSGAESLPQETGSTAMTDPQSNVLLVLPEGAEPTAAAPPADTPAAEAIESHVQQVTLADGGNIELGGIAWSETGPFALINGRVVGPGAEIGAFTLERIRPGHVVLTGEGRRILLSLK